MRGFTLIEILVVLAISSILLAIGGVSLQSFRAQSDMHRGVQETLSILRLAQNNAVSSLEAEHHGVFFLTDEEHLTLILFRGASYEDRDPSADREYLMPSSLELSELSLGEGQEVVFQRVTGSAIPAGSLTMRSRLRSNIEERIVITNQGVLAVGAGEGDLGEDRLRDSRHAHIPYQGRDIELQEDIVLRFLDSELNEVTHAISVENALAGGQVHWEGTVNVGEESQYLIVRTHLFNDPSFGTVLSIHRDKSKNTAPLTIEFSGDATGSVVLYDAEGETFVGTSAYTQDPIWQ
ncbi:MAG: type II secretion system protein [bacterium]|nr:type II secretion system protein [bacterium]